MGKQHVDVSKVLHVAVGNKQTSLIDFVLWQEQQVKKKILTLNIIPKVRSIGKVRETALPS